jgi:dTDP-4-amino-4,6-dideoxygalactose transaminase
MAVFNSLGSNYSWQWVWHSLFTRSKMGSKDNLVKTLGEYYGGATTLTYKGREALEIALKQSGLPAGSMVGINGFTCFAVYQAVVNAGYSPVTIDITPGQLNFGPTELKHAHTKNPEIKGIIIQNTIGYLADLNGLLAYCQEAGLMIVEDLAHCTGATYASGQEVGTIGAFTMMSFSQDKPLDVVAGGAFINRRGISAKEIVLSKNVGGWQRFKNRFYPFWSSLIRMTYSFGIGRLLHYSLKKLNLMATPMSDDLNGLHEMSERNAGLILERWQMRGSELKHRRDIAALYSQQLPPNLQAIRSVGGSPSYLRYPIWVENRQPLIDYLRTQHIYIGDTWYDAPIGPRKYLSQTDYRAGNCPNAEALVAHIVNLPTHLNVTPEVATSICAKIKQWQTLAQKQ